MNLELKKLISATLLFVLAWSCFGLNLGMIGHSLMQSGGMEHGGEMSAMHDCCVAGMDGQNTQDTAMMDHHVLTSVVVKSADFSLLVTAFFSAFFALTLLQLTPVYTSTSLYLRRWRERFLYFALHFQKLFSQGILHPKTW